MKKAGIPLVISFVLLMGIFHALGQQTAQPTQYQQEAAPVSVHQISPNVYEVLGGSGANGAFIVSDKEVFAVDAKMSEQSANDMIAAIKKTTDKPVSHILLTHSDRDHVNGLGGFSEKPDIIAHTNAAKHIEAANETADDKLPLPNETFYKQMRISSGTLQIDLLYFGPAHTDGDIVIFIPEDNVAIIGDLFFPKKQDPLIHMDKNGSSFGLVSVLKNIIALDVKTYLSGHAEPVAKAEIDDLRRRIVETQSNVKAMVQENKSLNEVKQAFGISMEQSRWRSHIEVIYLELTKERM